MSLYYNSSHQPFKEFKKYAKNDWLEYIKHEFPGKKSHKVLSGIKREELDVFPVHTREDLRALQLPAFGSIKGGDIVLQQLVLLQKSTSAGEVNTQVLQALNSGVNGVDFHISGAGSSILFKEIFDKVAIPDCSVSFHLNSEQLYLFEAFLDYALNLKQEEKIRGALFLLADLNKPAQHGRLSHQIAKYFSKKKSEQFHLLGVSSLPFADEGASVIQELAYTISLVVHHLDKFTDFGYEPLQIIRNVEVELATQSNYFIDIARFRAIRFLLCQIAEAYQVKGMNLHDWKIRAVSGKWNKTIYGSYANMLRNTTEAMGAMVGGSNALALLPHDFAFQKSGSFGNRMARNIIHILKHEAHIAMVEDPAAGSYFIENLTEQIITKAWEEFLSVEQAGGLQIAMEKGEIQQRIAGYRALRQTEIKSRKKTLIGANRFTDPEESLHREMLKEELSLTDQRGASLFENLRLQVDQHVKTGNPRPVVGIGVFFEMQHAASINARLAFIKDILSSAGLKGAEFFFPAGGDSFKTKIEHEVIVLCGSNEYYEHELGLWLEQSNLAQNQMVWLAGLPENSQEKLRSLGVHNFIYAGGDVWQVLVEIIKNLKIKA